MTTIDTHSDHVSRMAWINGTPIEADATHVYTTVDGVTYRAVLEPIQ